MKDLLEFLELVSGLLAVVAVLEIYAKYGFGIAALLIVFAYLVGWEIVAEIFSNVERKIPGPLRILWRILENIIEIVTPGP